MRLYSIQIPPLSSAIFYKVDGTDTWYHVQDQKHPLWPFSRSIWNSTTKTFEKIDHTSQDTVLCPLIMCHPQDVQDYIDHQIPSIKTQCEDAYSKEQLERCNIFVGHSDLRFDPVYIGLFAHLGIGETLWKKP